MSRLQFFLPSQQSPLGKLLRSATLSAPRTTPPGGLHPFLFFAEGQSAPASATIFEAATNDDLRLQPVKSGVLVRDSLLLVRGQK